MPEANQDRREDSADRIIGVVVDSRQRGAWRGLQRQDFDDLARREVLRAFGYDDQRVGVRNGTQAMRTRGRIRIGVQRAVRRAENAAADEFTTRVRLFQGSDELRLPCGAGFRASLEAIDQRTAERQVRREHRHGIAGKP